VIEIILKSLEFKELYNEFNDENEVLAGLSESNLNLESGNTIS